MKLDRGGASKLVRRLGKQAEVQGIGSLNEHQRNVLVPYWALGILENGGFRYFFEGSYDLADVARRFRALGFGAVAEACQQVASGVFGDASPSDPRERRAILARIDWEAFRPQKETVFGLSWEELEDAIARYASSHPDAAS